MLNECEKLYFEGENCFEGEKLPIEGEKLYFLVKNYFLGWKIADWGWKLYFKVKIVFEGEKLPVEGEKLSVKWNIWPIVSEGENCHLVWKLFFFLQKLYLSDSNCF